MQKVVIVGAGPVGSLAALYAAMRGDSVELYELRGGTCYKLPLFLSSSEVYFVQREEARLIYSTGNNLSPEPVDMLPGFF